MKAAMMIAIEKPGLTDLFNAKYPLLVHVRAPQRHGENVEYDEIRRAYSPETTRDDGFATRR